MNKKSIAIYGLGTETERELPTLNQKFNIVGLLDSYRTQGTQFGISIVKLENIIRKIDEIIVVARPGSCKAISKKIGNICRANNVELYDIRGNNLLHRKKVIYDFKSLAGYTKTDILAEISKSSVISFDLFDTLVMRNVLSFLDIISIVEERLKERGIFITDFCDKRIAAEKKLAQRYAPTLKEIYEQVLKENEDISISAEKLAEVEYETDFMLLTARKEVVRLIDKCKALGKRVYITTDCYYGKNKIEKILKEFHITEIDDVLVSCEYGTAKSGKLFKHLIEVAGTTDILHIGDDDFADIESAQKYSIKTFKIYSGEELLDSVGGLGLIKYIFDLSDSIRVGMFVANIFNSPFQFENVNRKICVSNTENIGYLFCAPLIMDFTYWFGKQVKSYNLKNIWFCARDGFLIKQLFEQMYPEMKSEYFLTSRISAVRAGMLSESDIMYVDSMRYSGEVEDSLLTRFGIDAEFLKLDEISIEKEGLLKYADVIFKKSLKKRRNNEKYIKNLSVNDGRIALFDFVAKGTSQMYIQRMVSNEILGLYFLQLEPEFMSDKGLNIVSFYTDNEKEDSAIFDNYYILETIITSPEPSVEEFDENGKVVYAQETRREKDIICFMKAQQGIVEYTKKYNQICPKSVQRINKKLDEAFLMLLHNIEIMDVNFLELKVEDPFFNRMTDIRDIL